MKMKRPKEGLYILYNEVELHPLKHPDRLPKRGIGQVKKYIDGLIIIKVFSHPGKDIKEVFNESDIAFGLLKYQILDDYTYTRGNFTYADLDLEKPNEKIKDLFRKDRPSFDGQAPVLPIKMNKAKPCSN